MVCIMKDELTYQANTPSDNLMEYVISSGKAYVRGFEVEKQTDTVIDIDKPRTTRQSISRGSSSFCWTKINCQ